MIVHWQKTVNLLKRRKPREMTDADIVLNKVYYDLGILHESFASKYSKIDAVVEALHRVNSQEAINPKTTGTISERLCELALMSTVPESYRKISDEWNWMADFSIFGQPFNLLISVKSFKAKERLLVSGSGNNLSPTVGWGLFDDPAEWTFDRTRIYLYRSFIAIYMPTRLYEAIPEATRSITNVNGNPFVRKINDFIPHLRRALDGNAIDITRF